MNIAASSNFALKPKFGSVQLSIGKNKAHLLIEPFDKNNPQGTLNIPELEGSASSEKLKKLEEEMVTAFRQNPDMRELPTGLAAKASKLLRELLLSPQESDLKGNGIAAILSQNQEKLEDLVKRFEASKFEFHSENNSSRFAVARINEAFTFIERLPGLVAQDVGTNHPYVAALQELVNKLPARPTEEEIPTRQFYLDTLE